jgi:hypothetical protein
MSVVSDLSPLERRVNRESLKFSVQRQIFCPYTDRILDVRRAVLLTVKGTATCVEYIMHADHWDDVKLSILAAYGDKPGYTIDVIDGRDYYTDSGRARS